MTPVAEQSVAPPLPSAGTPSGIPTPPTRWQSSQLFGAHREVEIVHGQAVYRLRLTAVGKLILTK